MPESHRHFGVPETEFCTQGLSRCRMRMAPVFFTMVAQGLARRNVSQL